MPMQVSRERWQALTPEQKGTLATICPDFVVELRSSSDIAVLKKVRYALCPMPYALCPMPMSTSFF